MKTPAPLLPSSWIKDICYRNGFIAIFDHDGTALLCGTEIPLWAFNLVKAGMGGRSMGKAFNRIVKGRYPLQRITDAADVAELAAIMKGA